MWGTKFWRNILPPSSVLKSLTSFVYTPHINLVKYRVYTNKWWGFISGLVKTVYLIRQFKKVFIRGTVVDFIHLKTFM
jgi:hypothetical protein